MLHSIAPYEFRRQVVGLVMQKACLLLVIRQRCLHISQSLKVEALALQEAIQVAIAKGWDKVVF